MIFPPSRLHVESLWANDRTTYRLRLVGALEGLLAPARATLPRLLSFREADLSRMERTR